MGTLASRILGAARDAVLAAVFPKAATDAFVVAFTIPNALRVLLGEGAVSGAFVPVLTSVREAEGETEARTFLQHLSGVMIVVLALVSALGVATAPWLVEGYAGGYDDARFHTTVGLTRWVFPYIFFMGLAALATGALNASRRFAIPAFAPVFLNIALITAALGLTPLLRSSEWPVVYALAFGALAGGALQLAFQLPALRSARLLRVPWPSFRDPRVRKAFGLLVPLLFGLGVYQVNVLLSRRLASFLPEGSQTYLYFGQRVAEIPQGLFAFAITSASLPVLSTLHSRGDEVGVKEAFRRALCLGLFLTVPATVAITLLAVPTAAVLFGRGAFEAPDIAATGSVLGFQALGIWAVGAVRTSVPMFHAMGDTRTPVYASAINLILFVSVAWSLLQPLGHDGIAIAFSVAAFGQLIALLSWLRVRVGGYGLGEVGGRVARFFLAALPMGLVVWLMRSLGDWSAGGTWANVVIYLATVAAGGAVYLAASWMLRVPELRAVAGSIGRT